MHRGVTSCNSNKFSLNCYSKFRLLAVFKKLKDIATPISSEEKQQELIEQATELIRDVCNDHVNASKTFVKDPQLRDGLIAKLKSECQELIEYIIATRRFNLEINSRSKDRVVSFGEKLSCLFMATLLQDSVCLLQKILPSLVVVISLTCQFIRESKLNMLTYRMSCIMTPLAPPWTQHSTPSPSMRS